MTHKLLANHEQKYVANHTSPKHFSPRETVFRVGGFGKDNTIEETFTWESYGSANKSAKKYMVRPIADPKTEGRYKLTWFG